LIGLIWMLISLGWVGTKIAWLKDGFLKERIEWRSFVAYTLKYIKRLFFIGLLFAIGMFALVMVSVVVAARWYITSFPERLNGLTGKALTRQAILDVFQKGGLAGFFEYLVSKPGWAVLGYIISGVWFLVAGGVLIAIIILVVDDVRVGEACKRTVRFLGKHWLFYSSLSVISLVLSQFTGLLWRLGAGLPPWGMPDIYRSFSLGQQVVRPPWMYLVRALGIYSNLLLNAFVLVYYLRFWDKKRSYR